MVDAQYDDMDWDYYEYGADEMKDKAKMSGIAKYDDITVYTHEDYIQENMNFLDISVSVEDLQDKYGLFAKNSDLLKFGGNLKAMPKQDITLNSKYEKAQVPQFGEGKVLSQSDEQRFKSGGNVVSFPQTAIGLVIVKFKNGRENRGSGCMIGPNQALTAAHILYDHNESNKNNEIQEIEFFSGLCGQSTQYIPAIVHKALILDGYKNKETSLENDIGILIFNKPQGLYCGWFGLIRLPDDTLKLEKAEISGYPIDKQQDGFIQYSDKGKLEIIQSDIFQYNLDATAGQNGGPIFLERLASETYSEYYLAGIHIGYNGKHNYGVRINKSKYEKIRDIMQYHFVKEALDESFFGQLILDQLNVAVNFENTLASVHSMNNYFFKLRTNIELRSVHIKAKTKHSKHILTNESLKDLSDSLKVLRKLENLKIDLHQCDNISDEGLKILNIGIQSLKELKDLYLIFTENKTFTSAGLKDFSISFQSLHKLESMVFILSNLKLITDDGLKYLGANIIKMQNLHTLQLDIQGLKKCTEKGVKDMCNSLKSLKLQKLSIIVMGIKIQDVTKKDIRDNFKHIPHFTML